MVTRTIQDMAQRAMELLTVLEAQEEVSAEDAALFDRTYRAKHAELTFREIAYWPVAAIPEEVFESVCMIMADMNCTSFGKSTPVVMDENGAQVGMGVAGMRGLRRIIQRDPTGLPTQALYF